MGRPDRKKKKKKPKGSVSSSSTPLVQNTTSSQMLRHEQEQEALLETASMAEKEASPSLPKIIVKQLWDDDERVANQALIKLENLCSRNGDCEHIILLGGPLAIVKAMERHRQHVGIQAVGCLLLSHLARDATTRGLLAEVDGIPAVVTAMERFVENSYLQQWACKALRNLVANIRENQVLCAEANGIEAITNAMRAYPDDINLQLNACDALYELALGGPEFKIAITRDRGITAIAKAAEDHFQNLILKQRAAQTLALLLGEQD